ncbi:MAG: RNB domain-containing ribonuclease [Fibrobacteraceae bacterium]|nr:RNB domain-containing ribonuclease [Fibrobacteraceae bacterium]
MQGLPSKEQIIAMLRDEPMVSSQLRGAMGISKRSKLAFKQLLAEMVGEGSLVRNSNKQYSMGSGEVKETLKNTEESDNRRPAAKSRRSRVSFDDDAERIHRGILHFAGEDKWTVTENETGKTYPMAHRKQAPGKEGEVIAFTLYPHPRLKHSMLAKVDNTAMEGDLTWKEVKEQFMKDSNLPEKFSASIIDFVNKEKAPAEKDAKGREDYRSTYILCIDPEGAMDHDDAVSVEKTPDGGYKLGVHIADVSEYVPEGSELDEEALARSYTQYLPWCAVPMLPDRLSSDLCSLHEGVDRFAFTCMMDLDAQANVTHYEFKKSIVRITSSITYGQAMERMAQGDEHVKDLAEVTRLLKANRSQNGILELGSTEFGCKFNAEGEPEAIVPRPTEESDSWIEECMLIANQCCAKELKLRSLQGVYRIHEAPDTKDIMELYYLLPDLFKDSPVSLRDLGKPRRGDTNLNQTIFELYQHLVKRAKGDESIINRILRSMQKAHYDSNSFGHFALNWQDYAHFTSPIRRYADLWCHRELSRTTEKEKKAERAHNVIEVCAEISANEIKNQKLERMSIKVCATWLLLAHLGEEFEATVTGIQQWGIYVAVKEPNAEGLVRFRDIAGRDYYIFNPDKGIVYGRSSGKTFAHGDTVRVRLLRANPVRGEADFAILAKLKDAKTGKAYGEKSREEAAEEMGLVSQPTENNDLSALRPRERKVVRDSYGNSRPNGQRDDRRGGFRSEHRDRGENRFGDRNRGDRRNDGDDSRYGKRSSERKGSFRGTHSGDDNRDFSSSNRSSGQRKGFHHSASSKNFGNSRRDSGRINSKKK